MKLETFFEKFDQLADGYDAVAKIRELVLQLAVKGKLVKQRTSDGNAALLLAAISTERAARKAELRTPNEPAFVNGDDIVFSIPSNWAWTQLGNIALQIQYGYTASADPNATEIRMLRITDIQQNRVDWPSVPGCQIESDEAERYLLNPNDILIARTGGTIGKSFIVPDAPVKSVFASYLIRVTPPRSMAARYLKVFLESPLYWSQLREMSAGTGQPNVNGQALGRLDIPLPPLAEQKRIVAKVDELMALCDRLEAQLRERDTRQAELARAALARFAEAPTPANLNLLFHKSYTVSPAELRKSILTLAVRGKLVPQEPNDARTETTSECESPFEIPTTWRWRPLGALGLCRTGKTPPTSDPTNYGMGFPFIGPGQITSTGRLTAPEKTITSKGLDNSTDASPGDLLMVCIGGSIGKAAVCRERIGFNQQINSIRPKHDLSDFIFLALTAEYFQEQVRASASGSATPIINRGKWERIPIPIPPLGEQRRIVGKVDQLMALVDALETQLAASRATAAKLLSAFVAELTPA